MGETIYKVLEDCEVKKVGERQYEFTASTSDIDRDNEIIDVLGWDLKSFKKNPVIMYAHDYSALPIGKAPKVGVREGKLKNTVEFPPEGTYEFADIVERLVNTGYLKTESVGFIPKKWEDGDGEKGSPNRTYTKQELLEISIVPVPSNPNALMEAVENGVITTKQFEVLSKPEETELEKPAKAKTSQEQITDELDYVVRLIEAEGMNEDVQKDAWTLVREILRLAGDDIPDDIREKFALPIVEEKPEGINFPDIKEAIKRIATK